MPTTSRKQRELQQREEMLLDVARSILLEEGLKALTMERLAAATEYSKGTIYLHFRSKDDVIAGLAVRNMKARISMFERAAAFSGRARERLSAVGMAEELFASLNADEYRAQLLLTSLPVEEVGCEDHFQAIEALDNQAKSITNGIVRDAIAAGDLELPPGTSPDGLTLALWGISIGTMKLLLGCPQHRQIETLFGGVDPLSNLRRNIHLMLDGYGWRPLSTEHDYVRLENRILQEVFADEFQRLRTARAHRA